MKFSRFVESLFLIYEISIYSVVGQFISERNDDCAKLYTFLYGNPGIINNNCCNSHDGIECDNEGHITFYFNLYDPDITIDIPSFPYLPKIEFLNIQGQNVKEIPDSIL